MEHVKQMLNAEEAADYIGLSKSTLAIWRSTGRYELPYVKVGRYVRYRRKDLQAFLDNRVRTHVG